MAPVSLTSSVLEATAHSAASLSSAGFTSSSAAPGGMFSGALQQAMSNVAQLESDASSKVHGLLSGDGVDVHAAMIATERADMAFQLTLAVRNKAVAAYQQLNGMQF